MWEAASKVVLKTAEPAGACYELDTAPMSPFVPPREPFASSGLGVYGLATENYGRTYSYETARPYVACNCLSEATPLVLADVSVEGEDDVVFNFGVWLTNLDVNSEYVLRDRLRFEIDTRDGGPWRPAGRS